MILSLGVSIYAYPPQDEKGPPEPNKQQSGRRGPPCDPGNGNGGGNGQGVPPPPGLCLPIDDYVYVLMAVGVMYGCYRLRDFENTKTAQ
ncbi:hypothetical protein [Christiangramia aestuarii]|uniref:Uncharacterized protein n=1 Tax=Christiangramia aestuarii TaxID=1028746 RepID=A0A7K1LRI0_9FLAO|nr:hypothetical protein [Christiangramia aestuarii]MUP43412.1 hypothetical protein [Christiangramia aestuarii]